MNWSSIRPITINNPAVNALSPGVPQGSTTSSTKAQSDDAIQACSADPAPFQCPRPWAGRQPHLVDLDRTLALDEPPSAGPRPRKRTLYQSFHDGIHVDILQGLIKFAASLVAQASAAVLPRPAAVSCSRPVRANPIPPELHQSSSLRSPPCHVSQAAKRTACLTSTLKS